MGKIIVSESVSLDGVVQDPTGDEGVRYGGWAGGAASGRTVGDSLGFLTCQPVRDAWPG